MNIFIIGLVLFCIILFILPRFDISGKLNRKGKEKSRQLGSNPNAVDVRKILGEMRYLAEETLPLFIRDCEIEDNVIEKSRAILSGERSRIDSIMDRNVREEWTPRLIFLEENQGLFENDHVIYSAFEDCRKIDKAMQQCTRKARNHSIGNKAIRNLVKVGIGVAAVGAIAGIAVVTVTASLINNNIGAKQMFTGGPKYNEKWIDRVTGEKFDYKPD